MLRIPLWATSVILAMYVYPWNSAQGFFWVMAVAGALFLALQAVLVLGTTFKIWEWLDRKCGDRYFVAVAATLTAFAIAAALLMMGFLYAAFAPSASCARNISFITFTLVICMVLVAATVYAVHIHEGGLIHTNLFTVGVLCPYLVWLCATALASAPPGPCSPGGADPDKWYLVCIKFVTLCDSYLAWGGLPAWASNITTTVMQIATMRLD